MLKGYAVVVGGAAMDVKARSLAPARLHTSNPGVVSQNPGGVGRNIAEGIARLGSQVQLVAAVGDDAAGRALREQAAGAGVGVEHVVAGLHPTSSYLALLDSDGELIAGISDFAATDALSAAQLGGTHDAIANAGVVVVDGNLPSGVFVWVLQVAAAARVRVVFEPVSVAKAARLSGFVRQVHPVFAVTPNVDELAALVGEPVEDTQGIVAAARLLHTRGVANVWVSRGASGSLLSAGGHVTLLDAPAAEVLDVTGAGDALTAGFVHGLLTGQDVVASARLGHLVAAATVASPHTVRPDLAEAVARLAAPSTPRGATR